MKTQPIKDELQDLFLRATPGLFAGNRPGGDTRWVSYNELLLHTDREGPDLHSLLARSIKAGHIIGVTLLPHGSNNIKQTTFYRLKE